jgi:hypothetical protein
MKKSNWELEKSQQNSLKIEVKEKWFRKKCQIFKQN